MYSMNNYALTGDNILLIQKQITNEYPDTTIAGNKSHTPSFIDYLLSHVDTWEQRSANVLFNIATTHPFPDGNKRTAINCSAVCCLEAEYTVPANVMRETVLGVARNEITDVDTVTGIIEENKIKNPIQKEMSACEMARLYRNENRDVFDKLSVE